MRVALEPVRPEEMARLQEGLRLLNRADPFVQVSLADSGEHVLGAAGIAPAAWPSHCASGVDVQLGLLQSGLAWQLQWRFSGTAECMIAYWQGAQHGRAERETPDCCHGMCEAASTPT